MKKILLTLLIPINIFGQYTNVPDANFELALLNLGYDFVIDGVVETSAIDTITELYINNENIADLTGIEDFIALKSLFCYNNNLSTINLSNNTQLFEVTCSGNNLISIDLRNGNNLGLWYFLSMNNPNLNCINVEDISYCEDNWSVDSWTSFSNNCNPTSIYSTVENRKLIKIMDIHGRLTKTMPNTPLIYIYSDGSIEKRIFIQ
jgi:Leucine-rich repeat (LRR) protein